MLNLIVRFHTGYESQTPAVVGWQPLIISAFSYQSLRSHNHFPQQVVYLSMTQIYADLCYNTAAGKPLPPPPQHPPAWSESKKQAYLFFTSSFLFLTIVWYLFFKPINVLLCCLRQYFNLWSKTCERGTLLSCSPVLFSFFFQGVQTVCLNALTPCFGWSKA